MNQDQIAHLYPMTVAVRRLFHMLAHGVSALHRDFGISGGMRAVLESVNGGGPQTVPQMARARPVSRQHIQGLVNALIEAGLVTYADNPAHRRSKLVAPTRRGRETFAAMRAREDAAFKQIAVDCSAGELAAADRALRRVIVALESPEWRALIGENTSETKE